MATGTVILITVGVSHEVAKAVDKHRKKRRDRRQRRKSKKANETNEAEEEREMALALRLSKEQADREKQAEEAQLAAAIRLSVEETKVEPLSEPELSSLAASVAALPPDLLARAISVVDGDGGDDDDDEEDEDGLGTKIDLARLSWHELDKLHRIVASSDLASSSDLGVAPTGVAEEHAPGPKETEKGTEEPGMMEEACPVDDLPWVLPDASMFQEVAPEPATGPDAADATDTPITAAVAPPLPPLTTEKQKAAGEDDDQRDIAWIAIVDEAADTFNSFLAEGEHLLDPETVRDILSQTGVPKDMLADIWELSDVDKDGQMDLEEFALSLHLCRLARNDADFMLPTALPPELIPPSKRGSQGDI